MVQDVEVGRAADAEAALVADATGAASVSALPGNDQPRDGDRQREIAAVLAYPDGWRREFTSYES